MGEVRRSSDNREMRRGPMRNNEAKMLYNEDLIASIVSMTNQVRTLQRISSCSTTHRLKAPKVHY